MSCISYTTVTSLLLSTFSYSVLHYPYTVYTFVFLHIVFTILSKFSKPIKIYKAKMLTINACDVKIEIFSLITI